MEIKLTAQQIQPVTLESEEKDIEGMALTFTSLMTVAEFNKLQKHMNGWDLIVSFQENKKK